MLVYEKKNRDDTVLCFASEDEKRRMMESLDLKQKEEVTKTAQVLETLIKEEDDDEKESSKKED